MKSLSVGPGVMSSRLIVVILALGLTGAGALPARGMHAELSIRFITADRDIECEMVAPNTTTGSVDCAYARAFSGPTDSLTDDLFVHAHRHWLVQFSRPALVGSTRRGYGSEPVKALRLGQTLTVGYFRCVSRAAALTCVSRHSGHGFSLGKTTQRTF